jgi:hypothetical protein
MSAGFPGSLSSSRKNGHTGERTPFLPSTIFLASRRKIGRKVAVGAPVARVSSDSRIARTGHLAARPAIPCRLTQAPWRRSMESQPRSIRISSWHRVAAVTSVSARPTRSASPWTMTMLPAKCEDSSARMASVAAIMRSLATSGTWRWLGALSLTLRSPRPGRC